MIIIIIMIRYITMNSDRVRAARFRRKQTTARRNTPAVENNKGLFFIHERFFPKIALNIFQKNFPLLRGFNNQ